MTDPGNLITDLRHAADIIEEQDTKVRRTRFVDALRRHAKNIEDGSLHVLPGHLTSTMLGNLKLVRDGWQNVAAHVRPLTPWEQECFGFLEAVIKEVEG